MTYTEEELRPWYAKRIEDLEQRLTSVVGLIQRLQPPGSPPPGDEETLVRWIVGDVWQRLSLTHEHLGKHARKVIDLPNGDADNSSAAVWERCAAYWHQNAMDLQRENDRLRGFNRPPTRDPEA